MLLLRLLSFHLTLDLRPVDMLLERDAFVHARSRAPVALYDGPLVKILRMGVEWAAHLFVDLPLHLPGGMDSRLHSELLPVDGIALGARESIKEGKRGGQLKPRDLQKVDKQRSSDMYFPREFTTA